MVDLRPFVCLFEDCIEPDPGFQTENDWYEHERQVHSNQWWCDDFDDVQVFNSEGDFEDHMRRHHFDQYSEAHLRMYTQAASKASDIAFDACPFCDYLPDTFEASGDLPKTCLIMSDPELRQRNQGALRKHIASELLGLFSIALPKRDDVDEMSVIHSNSKDDRSSIDTTFEVLPDFRENPPSPKHTMSIDSSGVDEDWSFLPSILHLDPLLDPKLQSFIARHKFERTDGTSEQSNWVVSAQEGQELTEWLCSLELNLYADPIIDANNGEINRALGTEEFHAWTSGSTKSLFLPADDLNYSSLLARTAYGRLLALKAPMVIYLNVAWQSLDTLLSHILRQLIERLQYVPLSVVTLYQRCNNQQSRPSTTELMLALKDTVAVFKCIFVLIDGLAVSGRVTVGSIDLLAAFESLQLEADVRILVTSNYDTPGVPRFSRRESLAFRVNVLDMKMNLESYVSLLGESIRRDESLIEFIKDEIARAADGL